MNFRTSRGSDRPEVNLIAFIDVLLVVVIFLMVSTSFNRFGSMRLMLPDAAAEKLPPPRCVVLVAVSAGGQVSVGRRPVSADAHALSRVLAEAAHGDPACQLEVSADALATHQSVVHVMEAARLAGLPALAFSTRPESAE